MVGDGEYTSVRLVSEEHPIRSYNTPTVTNQDRVPHSKHAKSVQSDPPDLGYIVSPSGLRAQRLFGEIDAPNASISKRANSTVTGIGVIAGGILVAFLVILLLGVLPCYLKRRRVRLQKTNVVDTENRMVTQARYKSDDSGTPFAKPLSIVKEESMRSVLSLSLASSETAFTTADTEERRSPPPFTRPVGTASLSSSPSLRRTGDRAGETPVIAPPPRLLLRPDSADSDRDRRQLVDNGPVPVRSRSVRFAGQNRRATPSSAHSLMPNPWDSGESAPPLPESSSERVRRLPAVPESAPPERPPRRAYSVRATGLPRNPRDFPVSLRAETTRSHSVHESASDYRRSFGDAGRPIRPI